ncbi:MAG: hypothetical protein WCT42_00200 [Candidatus Paceibacterota bacterium]
MERSFLNFSEINGSIDFCGKSTEILVNLKFPVEGNFYFSGVEHTPENFKTSIPIAKWGSNKNLKDITSVVSFVVSCEKWETTEFYLVQSGGFPCLIRVCKSEGVRALPKFSIWGPDEAPSFGSGVEYTPLLESSFLCMDKREFQIDPGLYPESPNSSYSKYQFSVGAIGSPLFVSGDKSTLFFEKETGFERIWKRDLPFSVVRFLEDRIGTGVLSQTVVNNKIFSLLENGLLFDGHNVCPKNTLPRKEYDYLVTLAKAIFAGWKSVYTGDGFDSSIEYNIDRDLTPCLYWGDDVNL